MLEQSRTTILQKSWPRDKFVVCSRIADVDRLERDKTKYDIHWKCIEGDNIRCDNERIVRIRNGWLDDCWEERKTIAGTVTVHLSKSFAYSAVSIKYRTFADEARDLSLPLWAHPVTILSSLTLSDATFIFSDRIQKSRVVFHFYFASLFCTIFLSCASKSCAFITLLWADCVLIKT